MHPPQWLSHFINCDSRLCWYDRCRSVFGCSTGWSACNELLR
jgi:hypothetical protein